MIRIPRCRCSLYTVAWGIWGTLLLLVAIFAFASSAHAATKPGFRIADGSSIEGNSFQPIATKSAVSSSYSKITFSVTGGTCGSSRFTKPAPFTVTVSNKQLTVYGPMISTIDNQAVDGNCTVLVTISAVRNATITRATATWTIKNDDVAPPPPPAPNWVSAPLTDGGYAMCNTVGGCHSWTAPCPVGYETSPPTCSYPNIIAAQGDVRLYMWIGCSNYGSGTVYATCRRIGGFWPVGHYGEAFVGYEGWQDEWGGVMPVTSALSPTLARAAATRPAARVNLDDRYEAVAVKDCLTPNPVTGSTSMSMSGVTKGQHYIASTLWVDPRYKKGAFIAAKPMGVSALGIAVVPRSCLKAVTKVEKVLPADSKLMPAMPH